jgi:hypothetical protein
LERDESDIDDDEFKEFLGSASEDEEDDFEGDEEERDQKKIEEYR